MNPMDLTGLTGIPLVVSIVQVIKLAAPGCPSRFYPLITVGVAIVWNELLAQSTGADVWMAAFVGLITGLSASGFYSHVKAALG